MFRYTFSVHNFPVSSDPGRARYGDLTASPTTVRRAVRADVGQILELVSRYAAEGLMLPRTFDQIAARVDSYVVSADSSGCVVACAALEEYSPSLAEGAAGAVAPAHQGRGVGSQVVLGVERLARSRDIEELFALSLTDNFFLALSYKPTTISRYPEKLARYDVLAKAGVDVVPKRCFQKELGRGFAAPKLVAKAEGNTRRKRLA